MLSLFLTRVHIIDFEIIKNIFILNMNRNIPPKSKSGSLMDVLYKNSILIYLKKIPHYSFDAKCFKNTLHNHIINIALIFWYHIIRSCFHRRCVFILHENLGSPIYISFPNKSDSGFSIGDRVVLNVTFKGNPVPEVSWMFNPWNSNISQDVPFHRIQNQSKYHTALVIETMSMKNFGTYKLRLKNIHGSISKDFIIEGTFLFSIFCFILPMENLSFCVLTIQNNSVYTNQTQRILK